MTQETQTPPSDSSVVILEHNVSAAINMGRFVFVSAERLAKLERISVLARKISLATYQHTGSPLYELKHLCIDLDCIDTR